MAFSDRVVEIFNAGALNVGLGLGYRLGLFETLDGLSEPASAAAIAQAAGLDARYVGEWLGLMASGGVVEVFAAEGDRPERFALPAEHGDVLCKRAGTGDLGIYAQELGLLVEASLSGVEAGFRDGRGLSYERFEAFGGFMGALADAKHARTLVSEFLPSVAGGAIVARLQAGADVCDLGCGSGAALVLMARAFPASRFVGVDLDPAALAAARRAGSDLGNLSFLERDAATLEDAPELRGAFDYVTSFDAIHDQTQPLAALRGVRALLRPEGVFSLVDIAAESSAHANASHPMGPFLYAVSLLHCLPVGLGPEGEGAGLGMLWGRQRALALLAEAGFDEVDVQPIPGDAFNLHYCCRVAAS